MSEEDLKIEQKIKDIAPFFDSAIHFLRKLTESVKLTDDGEIFETSERIIYPSVVLLDHPYPIIQCRKRLFFKQNKIEISYGIFAILGMLGALEEAAKKIIMYGLPYEGVWQSDKDNLMNCVRNTLNYLEQAYNAAPGTVPEMPEMTLHWEIFYEALRFIVGHELSHYLDPYFNFDYREMQQSYIRDICLGVLKELKRTRYKKYADEFINNLSEDPDERAWFYKNMVEEVLADYEGYLYLWRLTDDGYKNTKHIMGISMAFMALRLMEYFEAKLKRNSGETFSISVKWREFFLMCVLYKSHNNQYASLSQYIHYEWYPYQIVDSLFRQAISELESENEQEGIEKQNRDISAELSYCEELLEKLKTASYSEVEDVFNAIDKVFDNNSLDDQFYKAFPAEKLAEELCGIGYAFYQHKIYDWAYTWWYRAVTYFHVSDEPKGLLEADCYYYLGKIRYDTGYYEEAADWYHEALSIRQNYPDLSYKDNLKLNLDIARADIGCGKYDIAKSILEEMLAHTEDEYIIKEIYRNMGIIGDKCGDNESALYWFFRGATIADTICGQNSLESATFYNSIGIIYYNVEDFEASYKYLMLAYQIKKSRMSANDISLTNTMYSLGILESRRGCYEKALDWLKDVLEIRLRTLGETHPLVADTFQSMGIACYYNKDYEEALMYNKRAFNILKETLGREHELTRNAECSIELCLKEMANDE